MPTSKGFRDLGRRLLLLLLLTDPAPLGRWREKRKSPPTGAGIASAGVSCAETSGREAAVAEKGLGAATSEDTVTIAEEAVVTTVDEEATAVIADERLDVADEDVGVAADENVGMPPTWSLA